MSVYNHRHSLFKRYSVKEWQSWKWQLQHRIDNVDVIADNHVLKNTHLGTICRTPQFPPFGVTPYYFSLVTRLENRNLLKTVIPTDFEKITQKCENSDPLQERAYQKTKCIVHRYPNRVLFITTQNCATYCRYCTRGRLAGNHDDRTTSDDWLEGVDYIRQNKEIREVIISGGDPFFLEEDKIDRLLSQLSNIPHLNLIRIGTKVPIVLPQRVNESLCKVLKKYSPIYICLHVIHPAEITNETIEAIRSLIDAGCVIVSQTVLLKDVNDEPEIIQTLMEKLLHHRVQPYALFHCDFIRGASHFRTSIETGLNIIRYLRKNSSGIAIPHYIIDPPGGKVTLSPHNILRQETNGYVLLNWKGEEVFFPETT